MTSICNQLDKLSPPSFVTTKTTKWRTIIQKWSTLVVKSKYCDLKTSLALEVKVLTGYIERKGTQLRLEKALMFTKQIQKVSLRWKNNDFYSQLLNFQKSVGKFDAVSGYLVSSKNDVSKERLPSAQWTRWIIYLGLRDAALLAKLSIDCENTIKYWFGLIDSGHHWGDSLVIAGILARIWFLSSKLVEDMHSVIYPCLNEMLALVTPNKSGDWPDTEFIPPPDLLSWLRDTVKLSFVPTTHGHFGKEMKSTPKAKNGLRIKFFEDIFGLMEGNSRASCEEIENCVDTSNKIDVEDEDLGIVVDVITPKNSKKTRKDTKKKLKLGPEHCDGSQANNWKQVKSHWNKFFINFDTKVKTEVGRKKLLVRIRKYLRQETDAKIKIKLKKLKKQVDGATDTDCLEAETAVSIFQMFIHKYVKKLKKSKK